MKEKINRIFQESIRTKADFLKKESKKIAQAANAIISAYRKGKKVILFGNGGSAADCQHIAGELLGRFKMDRKPLPAISLVDNTSALTAISNDYGYLESFAKQLEAFGEKGDIAIAISTSGNSLNVVEALKRAKDMGLVTIAFTGNDGGKLKDIADMPLIVPSKSTPRIQESHITLGHAICELVEEGLFKKS